MSRKTFTIIVIAVIIVVMLGGLFIFLTERRAPAPLEGQAPREFFPFGRRAPKEEAPRVIEVAPIEIPEGEIEEAVIPKLRQLSTFPVAGAVTLQKERPIEKEEPEVAVDTYDFSEYPVLKLGDSGSEVENLQIVLNRFLEQETVIESAGQEILEVNGELDEETTSAVITFQEENNLVADGIAGKKTFAALNEFQEIGGPEIETVTAVRYVERATGHVYEAFLNKLGERRLSDTTIPRVHEALFGAGGEGVILRYLKDDPSTSSGQAIESFSGTLDIRREGFIGDLRGVFLAQNISDISVSPSGDKIFYLSSSSGGVVGTTTDFSGDSKTQVFDSPFTEWLSQWVDERIITLNTKPSGFALGFLYTLDTKTGAFNKVLGDILGLTTLTSPDGKIVLYSTTTIDDFRTLLYDTDERNSINIGIKTLPEKCVWAKDSVIIYCGVPSNIDPDLYPDTWYQGLVSFSDNIWRIDTETNISNLVIDPLLEASEAIDAINLSLDENGDYLIFINKKDSILWSLEL